jgi:hypothetical protein
LRADAGTRTPDPFITSEVLYQLSYVGASKQDTGGRQAAAGGLDVPDRDSASLLLRLPATPVS